MIEALQAVRCRNALRALAQNDFAAAAALLEQLRGDDPLSVQTRGLELEYLIRTQQFDQAGSLARELVVLFPGSARIFYLAGRLAYALKEYDRAEEMFAESLRLYPNAYCRRFLGKTLTQRGRLDDAESILLAVLPEVPACHLDLAWLYERRDDCRRALQHVEAYLQRFPENSYAHEQKSRLMGRAMEPSALVDDLDGLAGHGEAIPGHLLPQYIENLIRTGQGRRARQFLAEHTDQFGARVAVRTGWVCYRLQAYDLAYALMVRVFAENCRDPKFLSAFEAAAARSGQLAELPPLYEQHASDHPALFGRIRRLQRRLESNG